MRRSIFQGFSEQSTKMEDYCVPYVFGVSLVVVIGVGCLFFLVWRLGKGSWQEFAGFTGVTFMFLLVGAFFRFYMIIETDLDVLVVAVVLTVLNAGLEVTREIQIVESMRLWLRLRLGLLRGSGVSSEDTDVPFQDLNQKKSVSLREILMNAGDQFFLILTFCLIVWFTFGPFGTKPLETGESNVGKVSCAVMKCMLGAENLNGTNLNGTCYE